MPGKSGTHCPTLEHCQDLYFPAIHTVSSPHPTHFPQCQRAGDSGLPASCNVSISQEPEANSRRLPCSWLARGAGGWGSRKLGEQAGGSHVCWVLNPTTASHSVPESEHRTSSLHTNVLTGAQQSKTVFTALQLGKKHTINFLLSQNLIH